MHDLESIRRDPAAFDAALVRRGLPPATGHILDVDRQWREGTARLQDIRQRKNAISGEIGRAMGAAKREGGGRGEIPPEGQALRAESTALDEEDRRLKVEVEGWMVERDDALSRLPNLLDPSVPDGKDEMANVVLATSLISHKPETTRLHDEIGEALGGMDFKTAAAVTGSRFVYLSGQIARLERALGQWMLDLHVDHHGYREVQPPLLVNAMTAFGTGHLPKFEEDLFRTGSGLGERFLIPTAEVPLTAWAKDTIFAADAPFPIRMAALTPCFRSEAGAAGKDTRGLIRQHQFNKVEMVTLCRPEQSEEEHERMTVCAERVLTELGLSWRRVLLCAGDTGFSAAKTFDLEVWLHGQGAWREISSCSNCRDFQARRMRSTYRGANGKVTGHIHTLNGSGVAVGRALVAVLENYQQDDGSVVVPEVLRPYMKGVEVIGPL
jgi:seryl-tRNA synthetase